MVNATAPSSLLVAALALGAAGCGHRTGSYVWVDAYQPPASASKKEYILAPGDVVSIRVYNQESMTSRPRVRADGNISLPLLGDVEAAGRSPSVLAQEIQSRLTSLFVKPVVTIALEEPRPFVVYVVGEVVRPGPFTPIEPTASVLQAIASAGGLTPYAGRDRIYVVRQQEPAPIRIRFTYEGLTSVEGRGASFRLKSGDVVVAE